MNQMKQIVKFPTLLAAHQADVRGPPVGRSPQVENRWYRGRLTYCCNSKNVEVCRALS